jgi:hypothetical protein
MITTSTVTRISSGTAVTLAQHQAEHSGSARAGMMIIDHDKYHKFECEFKFKFKFKLD